MTIMERYYYRYVGDTLAVFETIDLTVSFYSYIKRQHNNIKFTIEIEKDNKLHF